ncbi:MAG TPA: hypothetical protein VGK93_02085 [Candidatus Eisenbacteria bacterium]
MKTAARRAASVFALVMFCGPGPTLARAQGTGRSLNLDPSIRAAGMAGASNAVFWGDDANQWANPALVAYHRGLRYEWGKTRLLPTLASDVFFRSELLKLGGGGLAIWTAGLPRADLGRLDLDYGENEATDPSGNWIGTFRSFERIDSWGWALSVAQLTESFARLAGKRLMSWSRYGDVSFGMSEKDLLMNLDPFLRAATTARDLGLLVRATPLRISLSPRGLAVPVRADVAYGWSVLSFNDATVALGQPPPPVSRHRRHGVATHVALGWPETLMQGFADRGLAWLAHGFDPLLSIGLASDRAEISAADAEPSYRTTGTGWEFTVANVFSWRTGSYEDRAGNIVDDTAGWSLGLHLGDFAGFRFDRALFPEALDSGLPDVTRKGFSAFLDPVSLWSLVRGAR